MGTPDPAASSSPAERSAVVSKAVYRAADRLGLDDSALARAIGLSEADISRLGIGSYMLEPGSEPYALALLLIRLFRGLDTILSGEEASVRSWMSAENRALGGVPRDLVQTKAGLVDAVRYIDAVGFPSRL